LPSGSDPSLDSREALEYLGESDMSARDRLNGEWARDVEPGETERFGLAAEVGALNKVGSC
jgi:hypothetical protein